MKQIEQMVLYTKSIYETPSEEDGTRISVMSEHTLVDGETPDPKIIEGLTYDEWIPELAPDPKDVGAYYREDITFNDLMANYVLKLGKRDIKLEIKKLALRALSNDITLLCVEKDSKECHRSLLASKCREAESNLKVIHR